MPRSPTTGSKSTGRTSNAPSPPPPVDASPGVSVPPPPSMRGWMWKYSTGRSLLGFRKNWKLRYFACSTEGISYYATEPFDSPRSTILWDDVSHIYDVGTVSLPAEKTEEKDAEDSSFFFGVRFHSSGSKKEFVLGMRSSDPAEAKRWVEGLKLLKQEYTRLQDIICVDEDEDEGRKDLSLQLAEKGFFSNLQTRLRSLVSLKKQRYVKDGLDLDMAYILPNVIAMGYPAEGREAMFRNPMDHVVSLFDKYHKGRCKVYNLCSERSYPPNRFGGLFARYPFDDHNSAPMELLLRICEDMFSFLHQSPASHDINAADQALKLPLDAAQQQPMNVAAVHCKAGKGRTGLVICCYLIYTGICRTADEALRVFGDRRTKDGKGVQIPSQIRYIRYFEQLVHTYQGFIARSRVFFKHIVLSTTPRFDADGGSDPFAVLQMRAPTHCHKAIGHLEGNVAEPYVTVVDSRSLVKAAHVVNKRNIYIPLNVAAGPDDVRLVLFDEDTRRNEFMCALWVHCGFLPHSADGVGQLEVPKTFIDDAVRDTAHKAFTADFTVTLEYIVSSSEAVIAPNIPVPALQHRDGRSPAARHAAPVDAGEADLLMSKSFGSLGQRKKSSVRLPLQTAEPDELI
jgi:phosphatidylinositol-3,4,5-trisphosphate 3-phosphatase/dual-specificity protein phosphatase PTEN